MKLILLAAAATLALPAAIGAQTTPGQTAAPADPSSTTPAPAPADGAAAQPGQTTAPADPGQAGTPAPGGSQPMSTGTPAGGYQPSGSAMQGQMSPGVQPTYQPAASPSQAYPAPAPKDSYPVCKKGQYDGCMEPGGSAKGGAHKARRHK